MEFPSKCGSPSSNGASPLGVFLIKTLLPRQYYLYKDPVHPIDTPPRKKPLPIDKLQTLLVPRQRQGFLDD